MAYGPQTLHRLSRSYIEHVIRPLHSAEQRLKPTEVISSTQSRFRRVLDKMTLDGVDERIYSTTGQLQYLNRLELYRTEKPYEISVLPVNVQKPGARRTNLSFKSYPVELRDFSSQRQNHTTDTQGFELDSFPTSLSPENFKNLSDIESRYHAEACSFLKQKYGAIKVFVFDTTVCQAPNSP